MDAVEISRVLALHIDCSKTARCQRRRREWPSGPAFPCLDCPVLVRCKPCSLVDLAKSTQGMIVSSYIVFLSSHATDSLSAPVPF
ncbi:hypothetical protein FJTKL_13917 [Diaporthe vaccinii]|uniref:Uncharacterized protein n=1 Tax=Diaporthe vaccinii TaxID=105482 RepID=A0ABR4F9F5_9PEZI